MDVRTSIHAGPASVDDYAVCRRILNDASRNYRFASRLLPRETRHHVDALYAFLRVGDDRVDVAHDGFISPLAAIDAWEASYFRAFEEHDSVNPVMRAYLQTATEIGIPVDTMVPYFQAMRDDTAVMEYDTFEDLLDYVAGSALPVGRSMTRILGVRNVHHLEDAFPEADALAIAMQLSNFWRDIGEDRTRGRVYVPMEDLERFEITIEQLEAAEVDSRLRDMLEFQFERTESFYEKARGGIPNLASGRWAVLSALEIYRAIIDEIRTNGYDVFGKRAGASGGRKLRLCAKAGWRVWKDG